MERALIAYLLGALVGGAAVFVEAFFLGAATAWSAAAIYTLAAGIVAATSRSVVEIWAPGFGGRVASMAALATGAALHLSYFANVTLLPGEPYWTLRSLSVDALVLALILVGAVLLSRSRRAQSLRVRFGRVAAYAGAIALGAAITFLAWSWPASPKSATASGTGPDLFLVVLDSARRDRLGLYGHPGPTSQELNLWATRARVFTRAYSASSWTVPSVEAFVRSEGTSGTLAADLSRRGYTTACFTDNPHLTSASPLLAGFARVERSVGRWRSLLRGSMLGETVERLFPGDDGRLVTRGLSWLERQEAPVFLYLHLMDSHTPYRHPPIDGRRRGGRQIEFPAAGLEMTGEEAEDVVARYDGGLRSADRAAGRLLGALEKRGRPWIAIITSDHGESLGESGRWFHGGSLAPELLAIPLMVAGTKVAPGRFDGVVGHDAIPKTLAAAAGLPCDSCTANDLRESSGSGAAQGGLPPHLLYRIEGSSKVVLDTGSSRVQLFDLARDPHEIHDLGIAQGALAAKLASHLREPLTAGPARPSPEDLERLRAVGYVGDTLGHSGSR